MLSRHFWAGIIVLVVTRIPFLPTLEKGAIIGFYDAVVSLTLVSAGVLLLLSPLRHCSGLICRAATFISVISYSIYLLHFTVIQRMLVPWISGLLVDVVDGSARTCQVHPLPGTLYTTTSLDVQLLRVPHDTTERTTEAMTEQSRGVVYPDVLYPMLDSSDQRENGPELQRRLREHGYLLLRSVLDPDKLLALRDQITAILAELKWIAGGAEQSRARVIGLAYREGEEGYFKALDRLVKLEDLYALAHDESLTRLMKTVLGDSVFPHPLSITRLVFPGHPEITTPPHQDYRNNQGTPNLTASWIPLGDCSQQEGGLAVLEGSHRCGLLPIQYHLGPGNRGVVLPPCIGELRWVSTDFRLGDVLLFPALTVHSALHNNDPDNMRLSVDFRHQLEGEGITPVCLEPHFGRCSWEEIYAGWKSDRYKYYWKSRRYLPVQWDPSLLKLENDPIKQLYHDGMLFNKARNDRLRNRST